METKQIPSRLLTFQIQLIFLSSEHIILEMVDWNV